MARVLIIRMEKAAGIPSDAKTTVPVPDDGGELTNPGSDWSRQIVAMINKAVGQDSEIEIVVGI